MKRRNRMSGITAALVAVAIILLGMSTVTGVRAALNVQSELYRTQFYLNHLQVHLLENGRDVCGGNNDLDGSSKVTGQLAVELGYQDDENLGTVEPGKAYKEEIAAKNGQDIDQFVRLTVRKYWGKTDADGALIKDSSGSIVKSTDLRPDQIHLMYAGKDGYNKSAWAENESERTSESRTYYYKTDLDPEAVTELLFDQVMIDSSIADLGTTHEETVATDSGSKTVFTYEYKYDGAVFFIEADVQAIQTHNINDAIHSQWGVYDVSGTYDADAGSGKLSVN